MKHALTFLWIFAAIVCYGQEQSTQSPADSIVNTWDLEPAARKAWKAIDSVWMSTVYWNTLRSHKIKMNCAHCVSVMMHVDMKIDSNGRLAEYRIEKSSQCGSEFSEKLREEFMQYFREMTFPAVLSNRVIHVLLGTGLKC